LSRLNGNNDIDTVRDATDLVRVIGEHVALKPKGREHVGLCPFHHDKTPSFCVVTHKGNAFYKCHACGAGGDAFDFVMNYHKMEFSEAMRMLADRANITLAPPPSRRSSEDQAGPNNSRMDLRKANAFAAKFFQRALIDDVAGAVGREVIAQRRISEEMVRAFMVGVAPDAWDALHGRIRRQGLSEPMFAAAGLLKPRKEGEGYYDAFRNRLIFPICDELGNPIAFGARKINPEDEPKYLNSAESAVFVKSKTLYGLHLAKRAIMDSRQVIVTEGYTDVIACHQAGVRNAVATLGTALTRDHARILSRLCDTVVLLFDGDEAGLKAADRGLEVFFHENVDIKICVLPDQSDPDELLKEDGGAERFQAALDGAADALQYKLHRFQAQLEGVGSLSGRQKLIEGLLASLADLGFASLQGVRKPLVLSQLAKLLNVSMSEVERLMPKPRERRVVEEVSDAPGSGVPTSVGHEPEIDSDQVDSDPSREESFSEARFAVSRARRLAEHQVLGVLVYEPSVAGQTIRDAHGAMIDPLERLTLDVFVEGAARGLARLLLPQLLDRKTPSVQQLLSLSKDELVRSTISKLYFEGELACGARPELASKALADAIAALETRITQDQYHRDAGELAGMVAATNDVDQLKEALHRRKQAGHLAGSIGRGLR